MANRVPLIVDTSTLYIKELPTGDNLDLTGSGIVGLTGIGGTTGNFSGIVTASAYYVSATQVISSARQLQNIASLDATTTATIESAVANAPNTFTDLNITGISTLGVTSATNLTAQQLNVSGISTLGIATATSLVVSGITTVSAGSTALPSITPSGDNNTGIFFPSADTIGASTGGTARITIDSSGNLAVDTNTLYVDATNNRVGVGTTTPSGPIHVTASSDGFVSHTFSNTSNGSSAINRIQIGNDASDGSGQIVLYGSQYTTLANILDITNANNAAIRLLTNNTERMRIRGDGLFEIKGAGTAGSSPAFSVNQSAPSNSFFIDSGGKLGLGSSSPLYPLMIFRRAGSTITEPLLNLQSQNSGVDGDSFILFGTQTANWSAGVDQADSNKFRIEPSTTLGAATGLTITTAGNFGIGATGPGYALDVASADTTAGNALRLRQNATAAAAGIQFTDAGATTQHGAIISDSSSNLKFATGNTVKMSLDSSGRLLVGTPTARDNFFNAASGNAWQFQVEGTDYKNSCASFISNTTSTGDGPHLILARSRGPAVGSNAGVSSASGGDSLGLISFQGADGSKFVQGAKIEALVDGTPGAAAMPGRLAFFTTADGSPSPTVRMTIKADGRVGINTITPNTTLEVNGTVTATSIVVGSVVTINASGINATTGIVTATTFQSTSDINLKENIKTIETSLNTVSQLRGVTFDWKNTHQASIGVIAQEVEQILPELVSSGENKTVNYNGLIGVLIEAIKEQEVRIQELERKVNGQ